MELIRRIYQGNRLSESERRARFCRKNPKLEMERRLSEELLTPIERRQTEQKLQQLAYDNYVENRFHHYAR